MSFCLKFKQVGNNKFDQIVKHLKLFLSFIFYYEKYYIPDKYMFFSRIMYLYDYNSICFIINLKFKESINFYLNTFNQCMTKIKNNFFIEIIRERV